MECKTSVRRFSPCALAASFTATYLSLHIVTIGVFFVKVSSPASAQTEVWRPKCLLCLYSFWAFAYSKVSLANTAQSRKTACILPLTAVLKRCGFWRLKNLWRVIDSCKLFFFLIWIWDVRVPLFCWALVNRSAGNKCQGWRRTATSRGKKNTWPHVFI